MKLAHKIYFVIALFTLPLMGLAVFFVLIGVNDKIEFAEKEMIGNEYQRPLTGLLEHVSQHQLLTQRALGGDASVSSAQLSAVKALVNQDIDRLAENDAKYGKQLQFTTEALRERKRENADVNGVKQKWSAVMLPDAQRPAIALSRHFDLISLIRSMIEHAGDKSNLILDPDLDSYYMMDMTLGKLPATQERVAQALSFGADVLERNTVSLAETRQLDTYAALFREADRDTIVKDNQTAIDEDKNFYGVSPTLQKNMRPRVEAYSNSVSAFASLLEKISTDKAGADMKSFISAGELARRDSFQLWNSAVEELDALLAVRIAALKQQRLIALLLTLGILAAAALISYFIIRTIARSVENVAAELHELAAGEANLTRRISVVGSQELQRLAQSFNTLMGKLLALIRQVQQSGAQVTSSSTEIAASTKQLEAAVTEQAASTNEVVATTKEISATSQSLVQTMSEIGKVASDTAHLAGSTQGDLNSMGSTMRQLAGSTTGISTKLAVISDKANNINKIVVTITKVADQTNLLSLNASIEAEKAGEHGLGFAVVAREIRRLADQTAVATLDIERMVKEMQSAVSTGVMEMDKFSRDVGCGVDEVSLISGQLTKIMERVQALAPRFETVTEGMQAQSQGAQQISSAMIHLSDAASQTLDSLRQTNSAIMDLNTAARGLHSEVSRFRTSAE